MAQIDFVFNGIITTIQCNVNDKFKEIINNYASKTGNNKFKIIYLYSGQKIENYELTFNDISNEIDKETKKMNIQIINEENDNNNIKIKSKYIICPKCGEDIRIKFNEYKIELYECKNGHKIDNILLDEFENTQYIDESKIICDECKKNNKNESYNKIFYRCNNCKMNICPICKNKHNKGHNIISYNEKNYICELHNEFYTFYCNTCKKDMCIICEKEHNNQTSKRIFSYFIQHEIISYGKIIPEEEEIKKKIKELKEIINIFNNNIDEIINKLKNIKENMKIYYKINEDIINNYNIKNKNYRILQNINEINNDNIIKEIKEINNDDKNKLEKIMNIYNKMNINEINIIYKINKNKKIKIFGEEFEKNNKDKCKIIYDNKEYELKEEFEIKNKNESKLNITLKNINNITNMSCMFFGCSSLLSLPDISK